MINTLIGWSIFFGAGVLFFMWETRDSARSIKYSAEFLKEFKYIVISFVIAIIAFYCFEFLGSIVAPSLPSAITESVFWTSIISLPVWIRFIMAYLLRDFTYYIGHRIMHRTFLWQTHKFHHSSQELWWLISPKYSLTNLLVASIGFVWYTVLNIPPELATNLIFFEYIFQTWVHINVAPQPWMEVMELVFVTPRFHAIHHMVRPEIRGMNLGGFFTFYDRMFGTYVDPATIDPKQEEYGIGDEPVTLRMMVGI
jgi:sterol desaturase/sphingolipid hydroxylase (fatty acid hydroxylase superfamily)